MQLGRTELGATPLIGVLVVLFVAFAHGLVVVPVDVPRQLAEACECPMDETTKLQLHADLSVEMTEGTGNGLGTHHLEPSEVRAALRRIAAEPVLVDEIGMSPGFDLASLAPQRVIHLEPDDGVLWGDVVETVSSIADLTGGRVAIDH